eukprot:gene23812-biopygen17860
MHRPTRADLLRALKANGQAPGQRHHFLQPRVRCGAEKCTQVTEDAYPVGAERCSPQATRAGTASGSAFRHPPAGTAPPRGLQTFPILSPPFPGASRAPMVACGAWWAPRPSTSSCWCPPLHACQGQPRRTYFHKSKRITNLTAVSAGGRTTRGMQQGQAPFLKADALAG